MRRPPLAWWWRQRRQSQKQGGGSSPPRFGGADEDDEFNAAAENSLMLKEDADANEPSSDDQTGKAKKTRNGKTIVNLQNVKIDNPKTKRPVKKATTGTSTSYHLFETARFFDSSGPSMVYYIQPTNVDRDQLQKYSTINNSTLGHPIEPIEDNQSFANAIVEASKVPKESFELDKHKMFVKTDMRQPSSPVTPMFFVRVKRYLQTDQDQEYLVDGKPAYWKVPVKNDSLKMIVIQKQNFESYQRIAIKSSVRVDNCFGFPLPYLPEIATNQSQFIISFLWMDPEFSWINGMHLHVPPSDTSSAMGFPLPAATAAAATAAVEPVVNPVATGDYDAMFRAAKKTFNAMIERKRNAKKELMVALSPEASSSGQTRKTAVRRKGILQADLQKFDKDKKQSFRLADLFLLVQSSTTHSSSSPVEQDSSSSLTAPHAAALAATPATSATSLPLSVPFHVQNMAHEVKHDIIGALPGNAFVTDSEPSSRSSSRSSSDANVNVSMSLGGSDSVERLDTAGRSKVSWDEFAEGIYQNYQAILEYKKKQYTNLLAAVETKIQNQERESQEAAQHLLLPIIQAAIANKDNPMHHTALEMLQSTTYDIREKHYTILTDLATKEKILGFLSNIQQRMDTLETYRSSIRDRTILALSKIMTILGEKRANVRDQLAGLVYLMSRNATVFTSSFFNVGITGPAGSGKTTVCMVLAGVLNSFGFLLSNDVKVLSPQDMTGSYLGESGKKTAMQLSDGLEKVTLIDEAYGIMACVNSETEPGKKTIDAKSSTYGYESITELVNFLDKRMGLSVVVVAGYEEDMQGCFFAANEGLDRRFPIKMRLERYSFMDLAQILCARIREQLRGMILMEESAIAEVAGVLETVHDALHAIDKQAKTQKGKTAAAAAAKNDSYANLVFKNQAGDMLNLASFVVSAISTSTQVKMSPTLRFFTDCPAEFVDGISRFLDSKQIPWPFQKKRIE